MSDENDKERHVFTEEELGNMLYFWDEAAEPVHEYHYMKPEWLHGGDQEGVTNSSNDEEPVTRVL